MGLGGILGGVLGALNPVGLIANVGAGLLGGGFEYLGGEADRRQQGDQAAQDRQMQWDIAMRNFQFQEDLAKQGIRWRTEDAEAAGLHPLAALGMMPGGSSPISVMTGGGASSSSAGNLYRSLSGMGQNLSRAAMAGATAGERALMEAQIEEVKSRTAANNAQAAESLARTAQIGQTPPIPNMFTPYRNQDGRIMMEYSPEFAASMMSRPASMWIEDFKNIMQGSSYGPSRIKKLSLYPWEVMGKMGQKLHNPRSWIGGN